MTNRQWGLLDNMIELYGAEFVLKEFMRYLDDKQMNQLIDWFIVTIYDNDPEVH